MAEIIIEGKPFEFEEKAWVGEGKIFDKEMAAESLAVLKDVLDTKGVVFLLNFGTLLGAIRENDFIGHDMDLDVAIYAKDVDKLVSLIPTLSERGLMLCRYANGGLYSFMYKDNVLIDVDVYKLTGFPYKYRYWRMCRKIFPKHFVEEYEQIDFAGGKYCVPKNPVKFIEYMYGKNWRIPVKGKHARLYPRWMLLLHTWLFFKRCVNYVWRKVFGKNLMYVNY